MRRVLALLVAAGLAGCGGESAPRQVDHIGYEVRLAPLDDALDSALYDWEHDRLRDVAHELERVLPPPNALSENTELARVLRHLAEDVQADDMLAFAEDWERLQDVIYSLLDVGYQPYDGPDDE